MHVRPIIGYQKMLMKEGEQVYREYERVFPLTLLRCSLRDQRNRRVCLLRSQTPSHDQTLMMNYDVIPFVPVSRRL